MLQILTPHAIDPSKTAEFPDVPRNHWAYNNISQLAGNGILVGYPDGYTFKGDDDSLRIRNYVVPVLFKMVPYR